MQIAQVMAGYSLGEADLLRRAMGKKKLERWPSSGAASLGGPRPTASTSELAERHLRPARQVRAYGFNKSHSAAYGYISYQTAYLKAHYRPEYMAALMTIESANTDKVLTVHSGLPCGPASPCVPVCVNRSVRQFSVPKRPPTPERRSGPVIQFGLAAVKNVGGGAIEAILEARERPQAAASTRPSDFFEQHRLQARQQAGHREPHQGRRLRLLRGLPACAARGARRRHDRWVCATRKTAAAGQVGLFAAARALPSPGRLPLPRSPRVPPLREAHLRARGLGLYLSGHPMQAHQGDVARFASGPLSGLRARVSATPMLEVRLVVLPTEIRKTKTRRGDRMAFVRLEDVDAGSIECVFFSDPWARSQRAARGRRARAAHRSRGAARWRSEGPGQRPRSPGPT